MLMKKNKTTFILLFSLIMLDYNEEFILQLFNLPDHNSLKTLLDEGIWGIAIFLFIFFNDEPPPLTYG
jgi:hypothetical protein